MPPANQDEDLSRRLMSMSRDFIFIHSLVVPGDPAPFLEVSDYACERLGYSREELLALEPRDLWGQEDCDPASDEVERLAAGREAAYLKTVKAKSGREIACEFKAKIIEYHGKPSLLLVGRELTKRLGKEDRYAKVLNLATDGFWMLDAKERIWETNPAAAGMLGYTPAEMLGRRVDSFMFAEDLADHRANMAKRARGEDQKYERRFMRKDGNELWALVSAIALKDEQGAFAGSFGIITDISERKNAEEQRSRMQALLAKTQKMEALGILAGGIAHDFNNILAVIMGYSELAQDGLSEGHPVRNELAEIMKAAVKARDLVRRILTFSREAGTHQKPLSLNSVVREAALLLARTIPKMVRLELNLDQDLPLVKADSQQMEQVVLNLVSNAADAIEGSGLIAISTQKFAVERLICEVCGRYFSGDYVLLAVKDSGSGMNPATKSRIFDPFFTTKGVGKGSGLGLSTVYGIVNCHQGHIVCHSQEEEGTDFHIYLPVIYAEARESQDSGGNREAALRDGKTILLVDDEEPIRGIAARMLTKCGFKVLQAASGEEALAVYKNLPNGIHGVILDLGMPGMGGKACLPEICKLDPQAKVLIASGYIQYELTDELQRLGAWGMVAKPYDREELLQQVRALLDG
jgi:two-component system cell cycle sensor histidine kinase/response regulator CckA